MTVEIREVAQDTYSLDCGRDPVFNLSQVAYLLVDDVMALIDPGSTSSAATMLNDSGRLGIDLSRLGYIIPTHIHLDHGGGAGYLAERFPGAKVVLHPRGAGHMKDPTRLIQGVRAVFGDNFEDALGPILPVPEDRIHVAEDGEVISLGKRELRIVYAPGHAPHHIAILDSLTNGLFCGDSLGFISEETPDIPFPVGLPPFNPDAYLETIDRLAALSPDVIGYAHHGARTEVVDLTGKVKRICSDFGDIIRGSIQAGEDDGKISERILEYTNRLCSLTELPIIVQASISGYVDYFRNRK